MHAVIGTIPDTRFPLVCGRVESDDDRIVIDGRSVPINRGTPALLGAALAASQTLGGPPIMACLVGDIGRGDGSRRLYEHLSTHLTEYAPKSLIFHYLQPDVDWHNRVLFALDALPTRPLLIADAGFMYAAKMSGCAAMYDLFTPDAGELAFLADEAAPHPFYTRGFILHDSEKVPALIRRAYAHGNAARYLLIKGVRDHLAHAQGIIDTVDGPGAAAMEAIGGTGDTLTGLIAALCASGMPLPEAAVTAARVNRWAGVFCEPTPATQVIELIRMIPRALDSVIHP